ncbi:hypothetical protein D3C75_1226570 [compost metagenome]
MLAGHLLHPEQDGGIEGIDNGRNNNRNGHAGIHLQLFAQHVGNVVGLLGDPLDLLLQLLAHGVAAVA